MKFKMTNTKDTEELHSTEIIDRLHKMINDGSLKNPNITGSMDDWWRKELKADFAYSSRYSTGTENEEPLEKIVYRLKHSLNAPVDWDNRMVRIAMEISEYAVKNHASPFHVLTSSQRIISSATIFSRDDMPTELSTLPHCLMSNFQWPIETKVEAKIDVGYNEMLDTIAKEISNE